MVKLILRELRPFHYSKWYIPLLIRPAWGNFLFQEWMLFVHSEIMNIK